MNYVLLKRFKIFAIFAIAFAVSACGPASQRVERSAAKRMITGAAEKAERASILEKDLKRDLATRVTRLPKARTVFRYMSGSEAKAVQHRGLAAGSHLTATGGRGRPMGALRASKRFGLPVTPSHRMTVKLPVGTRVRANKVIGGARGVGELRLAEPVNGNRVQRTIRLAK